VTTPNILVQQPDLDTLSLNHNLAAALSELDAERAAHLRALASLLRARDGDASERARSLDELAAAATALALP